MSVRSRVLPVSILLAALCLPAGAGALFAAEDEGVAVIRGIIYRADEVTRLQGALVTAINVRTGRRYSSVHTGANGAYEIAGLPAGTYDIAIDTPDDNLYVTGSLIELRENQRLTLSLSLKQSGGAVPGGPSRGAATQSFTDPGAVPAPPVSSGEAAEPQAKSSREKSSGEPAETQPEEKKSSKKTKKPSAGTKPKTGSGATASLSLPPAPASALS